MEGFSEDYAHFGERIKERRQELDLSLRDLAELTNLSATFLSNLERGRANPTLASALSIAHALKIALPRLLADSTADNLVVRSDKRVRLVFPDTHVSYEVLTPQVTRKMVLFRVCLAPETGYTLQQLVGDPSEECIVVLAGTVEITLAGKIHELQAGDCIYFENRYLENIRALGDTSAEYISAIARAGN
jgi:transcriptional regulator with XRE-family HTH domain